MTGVDTAAVPGLERVGSLRVEVGNPVDLGSSPLGQRRMVAILGGSLDGQLGRGTILPGGADWQTMHADGSLSVEAHYSIRLADAVITGASQGLGRALAEALADRGWRLIIDARRTDRLAAATEDLAERTTVIALAGDITDAAHRAVPARGCSVPALPGGGHDRPDERAQSGRQPRSAAMSQLIEPAPTRPSPRRGWAIAPADLLSVIALGATVVAGWPLVAALRAPPPLSALIAHMSGMLAGYGVVVLLALMSRAPALERGVGADVLTRWHGRGGRNRRDLDR